ncbi:MAG TPA: 4Fe-4S dicluster domain-containing protein [bacterium]|nr:4Fe-4S dicluster domain-containing protein [bacterium]
MNSSTACPEPAPCSQPPGRLQPLIARQRCEGKHACVDVCPYAVFEVRVLTPQERRDLSWFTRLRVAAHGNRQAFAIRAQDCQACGRCISACPEHAIQLVAAQP